MSLPMLSRAFCVTKAAVGSNLEAAQASDKLLPGTPLRLYSEHARPGHRSLSKPREVLRITVDALLLLNPFL